LEEFLWRELDSSFMVKGLENNWLAKGSGRNALGKLGKKQDGGQMEGMRLTSFWILAVLAGALAGSRFLWRKRLMVFQKTEGLVKGEREEQKFLKDSFLTLEEVVLG
jgi:hypothetical protein